MLSRPTIKTLVNREPRFDDITNTLQAQPALPRPIVGEVRKAVALARKFNDRVIRPGCLELDLKMHEDPAYLPWNFVKEAGRWGFYSMLIPKMFGGGGVATLAGPPVTEELASVCLGMANLIQVHYLGVASLACTMNTRLMNKLFRETAAGEKSGQPCLLSTAITEPGAGTDVEETDLVDRGRVSCHAQKMDGGYLVNGTKVFISNGHLSTWHILIAYRDLEKPSHNTVVLAVRNGMKGFSFGKREKKMGQKGCPASELVFDDCFVPDEYVCGSPDDIEYKGMNKKDVIQLLLDDVLSASRAGVGAFGAGAARGAFEAALDMAAREKINGRLLINHEWAQCLLAEMYKNVVGARLTYMESAYANGLYGSTAALQARPAYYNMKFTPRFWFDRVVSSWLDKPAATRIMRRMRLAKHSEDKSRRVSGLGSLAKFYCTDMGVRNCHLALDLMGQAGLRHDRRAEKFLRDAKLLQIYEGTNQLNRLNVFKCLIGRSFPQTTVFEE